MNNVIADLREASNLLENDPIRTEGSWQENTYTFTSFRKMRLNWYAVQLLLARAELYRGNKSGCVVCGRNVIDAQGKMVLVGKQTKYFIRERRCRSCIF